MVRAQFNISSPEASGKVIQAMLLGEQGLGYQPFPAFGAPARQNLAAVSIGHSSSEAVGSFALDAAGVICALHGTWSIKSSALYALRARLLGQIRSGLILFY